VVVVSVGGHSSGATEAVAVGRIVNAFQMEKSMHIMSKLQQHRLTNARKPTGRFGRLLIRAMNISHYQLTDWGLSHLSIGKQDTILDVGCGGGGAIRKLAKIAANGKVYGIDFSDESVMVSRMTNRRWVQMGRVEIQQGSVSCLPFPDSMFDLVTAVNTHNFWPDLVTDMQEILRVLKPGGKLTIIGSVYKGGKYRNYHNREDYAGCKTCSGNSLLRHRMAAAMRLAPRSVTRYRRPSLTLAIRPCPCSLAIERVTRALR